MKDEKTIETLNVNWGNENYSYSHFFSLENLGQHVSKIYETGQELKNPEFLYKFYGANENSLNSLLEGYLYFSNPRHFNDPFDCLTNREEFIINAGGDKLKQHRDNIGVCCFSTINNNPLMWGHYANSYSGFCLKFENEDLLRNKQIAIKSNVAYLKNYKPSNDNITQAILQISNSSIKEEFKEHIQKSLKIIYEYCWKYYDWKYEKEYRAVSLTSNSFERKYKFDKTVVKEVYIGQNMKKVNPNYYNLLMHILKKEYPHAKIYQVRPNPLVVKLEFEEILD